MRFINTDCTCIKLGVERKAWHAQMAKNGVKMFIGYQYNFHYHLRYSQN